MADFQTSTECEDNIYETINPTLPEENIYSEIVLPNTPSDATEKKCPTPPGYTEVGSKCSPAMNPQADHSKSANRMSHYVVMKATTTLQPRSSGEHNYSTKQKQLPPPTHPKTKRSKSVSCSSSKQPPAFSSHRYQSAFGSANNLTHDGGMQLSEFVAANLHFLPKRVKIVKGVHGLDDKPFSLASDILNIHQVIERDVAKVEDTLSQQSFLFPTNSVVKFSPVYHRDVCSASTLDDTCFSIAELLSLEPLPTVVCVLTGYNSGSLSLQLETNEILVVKGIVTSDSPHGPSTLQVYSIHAKCEKILSKSNVVVRLSVTPEYLRMSLSEITEHVLARPLPVMLFSDSVSASKIPKHFFSRVLQLKEVITEVLLLATYVHAQPGLDDKLLSIPIDLDIKVCVIGIGKDEMRQLKSETTSIVASKHTSVQTVHLNTSIDTQTSQEEIYAAVRPQKYRLHISSKQEDSPIYEDAISVRSTLIQSHLQLDSSQNLKLRQETGTVNDEDTMSRQRYGNDLAVVESPNPKELIINQRTQPTSGNTEDCTSLQHEPADYSKHMVLDSHIIPKHTDPKKPPVPPKPLGLKPSSSLPRKKALTSDIQGQLSLARAEGTTEDKTLESSHVTDLRQRTGQIKLRDSDRVGEVLNVTELENKKTKTGSKPPPVPPKPPVLKHLQSEQTAIDEMEKLSGATPSNRQKPRRYYRRSTGETPASTQLTQTLSTDFLPPANSKAHERMQTDQIAHNETNHLPEVSPKAIQKPKREIGKNPASPQTLSSEISPESKAHAVMQTDQSALNETHQLPKVSPKAVQNPKRYSNEFDEAQASLQSRSSEFSTSSLESEASEETPTDQTAFSETHQFPIVTPKTAAVQKQKRCSTEALASPQTKSSTFSPFSSESKASEEMLTDLTIDEASASTRLSSQLSPSLFTHSAQDQPGETSHGRQQSYGTSIPETNFLDSSIMTFPAFVAKFAESLPIRIRVQEGLYEVRQGFSSANTYPLSTNDVYNIHFLKETKVVTFSDQDSHVYTAPLNSSVQFCPLYDPEENFSRAVQGYEFDSVKDILTIAELPKVICATRPYTGPTPKSSVIEREVLAIRKASRTTFRKKPVLKVYSITTNEEKVLHEDCQGHFSTAPQLVHLHLPEIIHCIPNPFPLRSIMTMDRVESGHSEPLPANLLSNTVTLIHESVELSVIATTHWKNGRAPPKIDQMPFEIPTTMDFPLSTEYPLSTRDCETLTSTTKQIYDHFDPTRVRLCSASSAVPQRVSTAREVLYQAIRRGHENEGVVLKKPSFGNPIYYSREECSDRRLPALTVSSNAPSSDNKASDDTEMGSVNDHHYSPNKYQGKLIGDVQHETHDSEIVKQRGQESNQIKNLDRKQTDQTFMKVSTSSPILSPGPPLELMHTALDLSTSLTEEEQNVAFLRTLNKQEILNLLDAMKLPQYKATFEQEQVDGVILAKCNETILESGLNITNELHRLRLMQVIAGNHSVESILEEANSGYVGFSHSLYT